MTKLQVREVVVLHMMAKGLSVGEIAKLLEVTQATVKFMKRTIRYKIGATTNRECVEYARKHHLVR